MDSPIVELLKSEDNDVRLTCGYRWLVWSDNLWKVYERKPYRKLTKSIIETEDEGTAVDALRDD